MSLADEMRSAAVTLETVSAMYDAFHPSKYPWTAEELRNEAGHVEANS